MSSQVSKNIFWMTFSRVIALLLVFFAYAAQRKYLGPYAAGQYDFVLAYVLLFAIISDFGIQNFITKKISEDEPNTKKYFLQFLAFEIFIAAFLYAALLLVAYFRGFEPIVFKAAAVAGLGMAVNAVCYPFLAVMTAKQDLRKVAFLNFINSLVNVVVTFTAIYLKKDIVFLAGTQLAFGLIDLVLYRIYIAKHLPGKLWQIPGQALSKVLKFDILLSIFKNGWPFMLVVGFSAIYNRVDTIIITKFLGFGETGFYTTAYKYFDILAFFPATISHVLYPFFASLAARKATGDIRVTLEKYLRVMVAAALPMAVGGAILAKRLIILVSDERYAAGAPALSILIWAIAILYIYIPVNALILSQLTKKAMLVTGANVIINIAGNILLIPHYGIKAAAIMTVISEALQGIFYFYFVRRNITDFSFVKYLLKPALAAAAMGIVLWFIRDQTLFVTLPAGAGVYGIVLLLLGFATRDDVQTVKNLFRKDAAVQA